MLLFVKMWKFQKVICYIIYSLINEMFDKIFLFTEDLITQHGH